MVYLPRVAFFGTGAQWGGKLHLELIKCLRPIADKYCEGKVKRTLERELKVPEITGGEVNWAAMLVRLPCGMCTGPGAHLREILGQVQSLRGVSHQECLQQLLLKHLHKICQLTSRQLRSCLV